MASKYSKPQRDEMIRRLEQEHSRLEAEEAQTNAQQAALVDKLIASQAALGRAKLYSPPPGDICPECWITHGAKNPMQNIPEQPLVPMRDRFVCTECGFEELRNA